MSASSVLSKLGLMFVVSAVLGVVVAGLAIPVAGLVGISARNISDTMQDLPEELKTDALPETTSILDADGNLITTVFDQNRINVPLSQISRNMVKALISIEDYRFYQHGALDIKGTLRAFVTNQASSGTVQGGSSITQQLVKQTLVNQAQLSGDDEAVAAATEETYERKLKELRYAIALEENHSKDWILERYLNTVYFGSGAYGIQSAARHYFGVNASELNLPQAATLAGLVKNPSGYDPTQHPETAQERRNVVLDRMWELSAIKRSAWKQARKSDLDLNVISNKNGCVNSTAPFFCDYVISYLEQDKSLGKTIADRRNLLHSGGLVIKTTLNLDYQEAADASVQSHVFPTDNAIGALAMIEPGTGYVRAISQSRPMGARKADGETYLNYVVPKKFGDSNGFQAGSTFKAFVLASAINDGMSLTEQISAPSSISLEQSTFTTDCPEGLNLAGSPWEPSNASLSGGSYNLYTGTRSSVNTFFAQVEQFTGLCQPYDLARAMGANLTNPFGLGAEIVPPYTLGIPSVSPLEMAEAYATFAARGLHCNSLPVTAIEDKNGNVLKDYEPICQQVMPVNTADTVNDVLRGVQEAGGFGYNAGIALSVPSAGKTGTINDNKAVWFNGFTPNLATASMIAGANSDGSWITLNGQTVGGVAIYQAFGATNAGPMWGDAMQAIQTTLPGEDFVSPQPLASGSTTAVPDVSGQSIPAATSTLETYGFEVLVGATQTPLTAPGIDNTVPGGSVAYSYPGAGNEVPGGTTVTLYISDGKKYLDDDE
ncbi:MAG: transglycosylase domain-containing protein [Nocardioides sp.]